MKEKIKKALASETTGKICETVIAVSALVLSFTLGRCYERSEITRKMYNAQQRALHPGQEPVEI